MPELSQTTLRFRKTGVRPRPQRSVVIDVPARSNLLEAPPLPYWTAERYDEYMASPVWRARKFRYFKTHPRRCKVCRQGVRFDDQIHLHHLSYERMGDEPNADLMPLCSIHHRVVHEYHKRVGGDLRVATLAYVAEARRKTVAAGGRRQSR